MQHNKQLLLVFTISLIFGCTKDSTIQKKVPSEKVDANFIVYHKFINAGFYEKIEYDTFDYNFVTFESTNSMDNISYSWNINEEKFTRKEFSFDFRNYNTDMVNIRLITSKSGYINDTFERTIYLKDFSNQKQLKNTTKFQFINIVDNTDTINLEMHGRILSRFVDTIKQNNCCMFPMNIDYSIKELAFSAAYLDSNSICDKVTYVHMLNGFIKTDTMNDREVYLRFESQKRLSNNKFDDTRRIYMFKGLKMN